jgi:hypothetical protein
MRKLLAIWIVLAALVGTSAAALAQGGMGPGPGMAHSTGGGGGLVYADTDAQNALPGFASGTFTLAIGTASASRIVMVGYEHNNPTGDTPTLNGTPMTLAAGTGNASSNASIWYAAVSSGTTATFGYGAGTSGVGVVVSTISGQSAGAAATPVNPTTYTATGAQPLSLTATVPSGRVCFTVGAGAFGTGPGTFTWTGTTSGSGDRATGNANNITGSAHATATGTVTVSNTASLSFGGTMANACWNS